MSSNTRILILNNIKLPLNASPKEAFSLAKARLASIGISARELKLSIYKKSIDARKKSDIKLVYSISAAGEIPNLSDSMLARISATLLRSENLFDFDTGTEELGAPPLVVGSGPCGLFAALMLAERGYRPILIERGGSIADRRAAVDTFKRLGILDPDTNIQFGAGGAGTFSDGKLVTRVNDPLTSFVLKKFVEFGAPEEILYLAKPHVGTDILSEIIDKMLKRLEELGAQVRYNTKYLSSYKLTDKSVARTTAGDIEYGALILAIGHSARDTYEALLSSGYVIEPKQISVGMRIEHKAADIDRAMFGEQAGHPSLAHAEYNLSTNTKNRGVYTFCMCPGGEVVAAASEEGGVVVNGMSQHARSGENSNCAVVCSVFKEDYGASPYRAIAFQREIEKNAYLAGGADYSAPVITVGDFLSDSCKREPYYVMPTYRNGNRIKLASPSEYLPSFVTKEIKNALLDFNKKIEGFAADGALLTGAETRTSAPIRILRDESTRVAVGRDNVYPAGEGAGYAGGITSAAIDGIKTAIAIMKRFKPNG